MKGSSLKLGLIPEQFTVKAHPAIKLHGEDEEDEGEEGRGRGKQIEEHFLGASA